MKPIPFNALAKLLNLHHTNQAVVRGAAIDSRKVMPGDLFFALPGNRVDGHTFLEEVAAKGAVGAVVREDYRGESCGLPLLHVPDVLLALQDWARKSLATRSSKVIAITGSLGKTTVKEFTRALLAPHFRIFASPLSYNSQATLPLSILMADETEEYLILEMAMTHKGQIAQLVSIAPPDIALITTVAIQHAVNFSDGLAGISREKGSIFSHPQTKLGLLPQDLYNFEEIYNTGSCQKKIFPILSPADTPLSFSNKVHYHNLSAAVAIAQAVDIPWPLIQEGATTLQLPPMRFERVEKRGVVFINDAYNANPDSMKAALESLPKPESGGKTIAVLSEMDALGMYTEGGHALVAETALHYTDHLLCLGSRCETMRKIWKREKKPVELFKSRHELESALHTLVKPGDVVLLKGARAYALDQILDSF